MATRIQLRRDTAADWTSNDPTLASGEVGFETDTGEFKIGDGNTSWASLSYKNFLPVDVNLITGDATLSVSNTSQLEAAEEWIANRRLNSGLHPGNRARAPQITVNLAAGTYTLPSVFSVERMGGTVWFVGNNRTDTTLDFSDYASFIESDIRFKNLTIQGSIYLAYYARLLTNTVGGDVAFNGAYLSIDGSRWEERKNSTSPPHDVDLYITNAGYVDVRTPITTTANVEIEDSSVCTSVYTITANNIYVTGESTLLANNCVVNSSIYIEKSADVSVTQLTTNDFCQLNVVNNAVLYVSSTLNADNTSIVIDNNSEIFVGGFTYNRGSSSDTKVRYNSSFHGRFTMNFGADISIQENSSLTCEGDIVLGSATNDTSSFIEKRSKFSSDSLDIWGEIYFYNSSEMNSDLVTVQSNTATILADNGSRVYAGSLNITSSSTTNLTFTDGSKGYIKFSGSDAAANYTITDSELIADDVLYTTRSLSLSKGIEEKFATLTNATGTVVHDCSTGQTFYHTTPSANWTANFTNLQLTPEHKTDLNIVVSQGATAYIPNAVQIGGAGQTILWEGGSEPSGTANNGTDVVTFTVLNDGGTYVVLGKLVGNS